MASDVRRRRSRRVSFSVACVWMGFMVSIGSPTREVFDDGVDQRRNRVLRRHDRSSECRDCAAASAVTGPIDATTVVRSRSAAGSAPSTVTKFRTADALVNVTTSIRRSSSIR